MASLRRNPLAVVLGVVFVAAALVAVAWALDRRGPDPNVARDVRVTGVEGRYDATVRQLYLDVRFEPKDVQTPLIVCGAARPGSEARWGSAAAWAILSEGVARKSVPMRDAQPGEYTVTCSSGETEAATTIAVGVQ